MLTLRALDPTTELHLFHEAYNWRPRYKPHLQVGRMSFETFSSPSPSQVVLGLFNPELRAVYFFSEESPNVFEAHFTAKRGTDKGVVFAGAKTALDWFLGHGATVTASILEQNRPVRLFVEAMGFQVRGLDEIPEGIVVRYVADQVCQLSTEV